MKFPARALLLAALTLSPLHHGMAFAPYMPLEEQVKKADSILRVVVVNHDSLKITEGEPNTFQALAKCRVIADYTGNHKMGGIIYIPCAYNLDPDKSPIDMEGDYVVMLKTFEIASIAHPVSGSAVHEVTIDKVKDPDEPEKEIPLEEFVKRIRKLLVTGNGKDPDKAPAADDGKKE